ncbi:MAG TPA: hypothetical protein V6C81_29690 [Planktothrix sp.]|jgi:hypothetical protein
METAYTQLCRTWQRLAPKVEGTFAEEPFIEPSPEQFDYLPADVANGLKEWYKASISKLVKNCAALRIPYKNWLIVLKTDGDYPVPGTAFRVSVRADYVPLSSFRLLMVHGEMMKMHGQLMHIRDQLMMSPLSGVMNFANKVLKVDTTMKESDPNFRSGCIDIDSLYTLFGNDQKQTTKFINDWRVRESLLSLQDPVVFTFGIHGYVAKQINLCQSLDVTDQEQTERTIAFYKLALDTLSAQGLIATEPSNTESPKSK